MVRSFLAIELPKTILKKIEEIQGELRSSRADVRWVDPEKIHLTLKFFGNIDDTSIESIVASIEGPVRATAPFTLRIQGIGAFPHVKNPRVIWMGLTDEEGMLLPFQKQLEMELVKVGFETEERPFQPHLTLGRLKSPNGKQTLVGRMEPYRDAAFGQFRVEGVVLFRSDLRPTGPIYTHLKDLKLGV